MEDPFGGMFKLTSLVCKSKMRDMLVVKDL